MKEAGRRHDDQPPHLDSVQFDTETCGDAADVVQFVKSLPPPRLQT